jgi:hypothetical protein
LAKSKRTNSYSAKATQAITFVGDLQNLIPANDEPIPIAAMEKKQTIAITSLTPPLGWSGQTQ